MTTDINSFKTKFDVNEAEPVFEESLHGPEEDDELTKIDSSSSASIDDEKSTKSL